MYKLIKANQSHAKQILPYLTMTCYWKEFVDGNTLNQSYEEFMLEWIINPRLPYTTVLVKDGEEDTVCGCLIALTTDQLATMPDYSPCLHPRVLKTFAAWLSFPIADSLVIELIFINKELRGKKYASQLSEVAEKLAMEYGKECLSCFIWSFFPDSLINFTRRGYMIKACLSFPEVIDLPLMYVEKRQEYMALKDYFQSEVYLNDKNVLLSSSGES